MTRKQGVIGRAALLAVAGALGVAGGCGSDEGKRKARDAGGAGGEAGGAGAPGLPTSAGMAGEPAVLGEAAGMSNEEPAGAGGVPSTVAGAGAGGTPACDDATLCLSDTQAYVCSQGTQGTLECTDGCAAGACLPSVLSTGWQLHQFALSDSPELPAQYSFSPDGLSSLQTINAQPSVYFLDQELQNVVVTGTFAVESVNDDDFIGLAFGWQDAEHFYLFDWKQLGQTSACGTAAGGAMLKLYSGAAPFTACSQFWESGASAEITPLVTADLNPTGWVDNTPYTFELVYKPGDIRLVVRQGNDVVVSLQSSDATYPSGRFGFYSCSQEQSRFELVEIQPAP